MQPGQQTAQMLLCGAQQTCRGFCSSNSRAVGQPTRIKFGNRRQEKFVTRIDVLFGFCTVTHNPTLGGCLCSNGFDSIAANTQKESRQGQLENLPLLCESS